MAQNSPSLAAHFRSKRRIFSAADAAPDTLVKQAQDDLKSARKEAEKVVFRFDFRVSDSGVGVGSTPGASAKKKKKNKKKKTKKKTKNASSDAPPITSVANAVVSTVDNPQAVRKAAEDTKRPPKPNAHSKPPPQEAAALPPRKQQAEKETPPAASKPVVPPPPGFLTLRKPTSSDSEIMKMQLRYGRGKRNLAAIAQREKIKQQAAQNPVDQDAAASSSSFQFNFFTST